MKLTENFSKEEFDCHDGSPMPDEVLIEIKKLAKIMEVVRLFFNARVTINSGYRELAYNRSIGSNDRSQHPKGTANDFTVEGYTPKQVHRGMQGLIRIGAIPEGGLGRYSTFTHYDNRGHQARWKG